jgi:hypothetical protein
MIVLADDLRGFIGWAIKAHTNGSYNHAFIIHKQGLCVSQDFGAFNEKSIEKYMIPGIMLKFWRIKDLTPMDKFDIRDSIEKRLALPKWKRGYDFLGVLIGQFFHLKFIQNPFQLYCSEEVDADYLRKIQPPIPWLIKFPNPSEINTELAGHLEESECPGYYWQD